MLDIRVFNPREPTPDPTLGVVICNHHGAKIDGDTGKDAREIANMTGLLTVAYDRPGTSNSDSWQPKLARRLTRSYDKEVADRGRELSIFIASRGVRRVILAGKSAAGTEALALACSDSLPGVIGVVVMDPVGWVDTSIVKGLRQYVLYGHAARQSRKGEGALGKFSKFPESNEMAASSVSTWGRLRNRPNTADDFVKLVRRRLLDFFHYKGVWSQPVSESNSLVLANHHPGIAVMMVFAGQTFIAPPEQIMNASRELPRLRNQITDSAPFVTAVLEKSWHDGFDRPGVYGRYVLALVNLLNTTTHY